jgi:hypothetical protein
MSPLIFPIWIMHQARKLPRVSPEHTHVIVGVAVPDHPAIRLYMNHPGTQAHSVVPLIVKDMKDFQNEHGQKAFNDTLISLHDIGRPSPIWTGQVHPKTLTFEVIGLSGEHSNKYSCNYAHTVKHLKDLSMSWVLRDIRDSHDIFFELVDGDRVLKDWQTCSEAGLRDGVALSAVKYYYDPPPPLVSDSD